jgi:hemerythrin-like domain-containing protein
MVQIGKEPAPSFDEPLEMLSACHERIEAQLATLERLCEHLAAQGNDTEARSAAQAILRYFDTSGRLHHEDEDHDLFPLLRERAAEAQRPEIAATIDELEREHETMEAQWRRLRAALASIAQGARAIDAEYAMRFVWLYRRHMEREAAAVLPFGRSALADGERAALGRRMAARRQRSDDAE